MSEFRSSLSGAEVGDALKTVGSAVAGCQSFWDRAGISMQVGIPSEMQAFACFAQPYMLSTAVVGQHQCPIVMRDRQPCNADVPVPY